MTQAEAALTPGMPPEKHAAKKVVLFYLQNLLKSVSEKYWKFLSRKRFCERGFNRD